jgi:hypothetical protein
MEWQFYFKQKNYHNLLKFIIFLSLIICVITLFLFSLNLASQRYLSDFSTFVIMLAIISFWCSKNYLSERIFKIGQIFFILTGLLSVYIGIIQSKALLFRVLYLRGEDFIRLNSIIFLIATVTMLSFFYYISKRFKS